MSLDILENELLAKESYRELLNKKRIDITFRVGRMVVEGRVMKNMTQKDLAQKARTSQSAIARLESGKTFPSLRMLMNLAKAMDSYLIPPKFAFMKKVEDIYDIQIASPSYNNKNSTTVMTSWTVFSSDMYPTLTTATNSNNAYSDNIKIYA